MGPGSRFRQAISGLYGRLPIIRELRDATDSLGDLARDTAMQRRLQQEEHVARLLAGERYAHPARLNRSEFSVFSQNGEDGVLAEVFRRIGVGQRTFLEIGVGDGRENNTSFLLMQGWSGYWIDGDTTLIQDIARHFRQPISQGRLHTACAFVTAENVGGIVKDLGIRGEVDLLSLDVDRNTYWIWTALTDLRPRVVVVEYNASLPPSTDWVVEYDAAKIWNATAHFGASLKAYERLGQTLGYRLVACELAGVNAFFVRHDLCGEHFTGPDTAAFHYEPPRYFLHRTSGHPRAFADD